MQTSETPANDAPQETSSDQPEKSIVRIAVENGWLGFNMALGDTFANKLTLQMWLLSFINNDKSHDASNGLGATFINFTVISALSQLFMINKDGAAIASSYLEIKEKLEQDLPEDERNLLITEQEKLKTGLVDIFRNGAFYSFIMVPSVIASLWFSGSILRLLGQDPEVSQITQDFLRPWSLGGVIVKSGVCPLGGHSV